MMFLIVVTIVAHLTKLVYDLIVAGAMSPFVAVILLLPHYVMGFLAIQSVREVKLK